MSLEVGGHYQLIAGVHPIYGMPEHADGVLRTLKSANVHAPDLVLFMFNRGPDRPVYVDRHHLEPIPLNRLAGLIDRLIEIYAEQGNRQTWIRFESERGDYVDHVRSVQAWEDEDGLSITIKNV